MENPRYQPIASHQLEIRKKYFDGQIGNSSYTFMKYKQIFDNKIQATYKLQCILQAYISISIISY